MCVKEVLGVKATVKKSRGKMVTHVQPQSHRAKENCVVLGARPPGQDSSYRGPRPSLGERITVYEGSSFRARHLGKHRGMRGEAGWDTVVQRPLHPRVCWGAEGGEAGKKDSSQRFRAPVTVGRVCWTRSSREGYVGESH